MKLLNLYELFYKLYINKKNMYNFQNNYLIKNVMCIYNNYEIITTVLSVLYIKYKTEKNNNYNKRINHIYHSLDKPTT